MKPVALLLFVVLLISSGCASLWRGAAEQEYQKAMREGRMSPSEYQQKREELRRQAEANP
jgi:uncharacterized protein YceK